jgi:uncharacterized membrane protein (UPF0127 family)
VTAHPHPFVPGLAALESLDLGGTGAAPPASARAFPDGGAWRLEIPSVEGPDALHTVLAAADQYDVPLHRISQGSGVGMLTDAEITDMVQACAERSVELCLFVRPGANWDVGAAAASAAGSVSARSRGTTQLAAGVAQAQRAAGLGVRSLLVADEGLLWVLHELRERGDLPADTQFKVSVMAAPANPAALRVQELLGADTVNVPSDLTTHQLAELRAASAATLDFYVEAPDNVGGFVRHHEIAEIVRVCAPVYVKFGLRNAPDVYPAGGHIASTVGAAARERVRRARIGLDELARTPEAPRMSAVGERDQPALQRFSRP